MRMTDIRSSGLSFGKGRTIAWLKFAGGRTFAGSLATYHRSFGLFSCRDKRFSSGKNVFHPNIFPLTSHVVQTAQVKKDDGKVLDREEKPYSHVVQIACTLQNTVVI